MNTCCALVALIHIMGFVGTTLIVHEFYKNLASYKNKTTFALIQSKTKYPVSVK